MTLFKAVRNLAFSSRRLSLNDKAFLQAPLRLLSTDILSQRCSLQSHLLYIFLPFLIISLHNLASSTLSHFFVLAPSSIHLLLIPLVSHSHLPVLSLHPSIHPSFPSSLLSSLSLCLPPSRPPTSCLPWFPFVLSERGQI